MASQSTVSVSIGDVVDRYEIRELVGEGGMGAIYRATDTRLGRSVALKVVRGEHLASSLGEQVRQRFLREALALSKVEHRNVVRVLDFGFWRDMPYLAMEYLRGRDLGQLINANVGLLPIAEVCDIMLAVCAAIRACHDVGVIHRDLKPSNIFLCEEDGDREVKILDFGISKPMSTADLTQEGQIIGTPQYLAPEQLEGRALPQTDQYAIGVVLYACLTGSLPYQDHANISLLRAIDAGKFAPPSALRSDLPARLEGVILRAMQAVPEDRFESVHGLGRGLWEFASPAARERWRSYYFDERPKAPPQSAAYRMPLVEALALESARGGRSNEPIAVPRTVPATLVAEATARLPEEPVATPQRGATALETPAATTQPKGRGAATRRWFMASLIAAGALALIGARWWTRPRPPSAPPPQTSAPILPASAAPTTPVPRVRQAQGPTSPAPPPALAPTPDSAARSASSKRAPKHHRRASDDVPILP